MKLEKEHSKDDLYMKVEHPTNLLTPPQSFFISSEALPKQEYEDMRCSTSLITKEDIAGW